MAKIIVHKRARKYMEAMDARLRTQLIGKLEGLAQNPDTAPNVKPMEGDFAGYFRLRHGDLRVVYEWDKAQDTVIYK
ncbi:MAG: Plasmid stabilization protein ParE [Verrucomicrobiaceae bacterium]|nr:Plasmid stabilization protein ParE [Verrucomicrobiaceae bacterium]